MFAAATNLLALFAFAVHAVFGCCVHHHHHAFTMDCVAEHANDGCCHEHADDEHEHEGTHEEHSPCDHSSCSHSQNSDADEDSPSTPCDGSHDCNEPQCSFAAPPPSNDVEGDLSSAFSVYHSDALSPTFALSVSHFLRVCRSERAMPAKSSALRCALAQSWQI